MHRNFSFLALSSHIPSNLSFFALTFCVQVDKAWWGTRTEHIVGVAACLAVCFRPTLVRSIVCRACPVPTGIACAMSGADPACGASQATDHASQVPRACSLPCMSGAHAG
eukprot:1694212-Rhodomonas_salina.3